MFHNAEMIAAYTNCDQSHGACYTNMSTAHEKPEFILRSSNSAATFHANRFWNLFVSSCVDRLKTYAPRQAVLPNNSTDGYSGSIHKPRISVRPSNTSKPKESHATLQNLPEHMETQLRFWPRRHRETGRPTRARHSGRVLGRLSLVTDQCGHVHFYTAIPLPS